MLSLVALMLLCGCKVEIGDASKSKAESTSSISTADPSVNLKSPNPKGEASEAGLQAINHVQMVEVSTEPVERINIWSAGSTPLVETLRHMFEVPTQVHNVIRRSSPSTLWLILVNQSEVLPRIPPHMRALFVLTGKWSQKELIPVSRSSEGLVLVDSSLQRFRHAEGASVYDQALAVGYELYNEYDLSIRALELNVQEEVHPALWHLANREWHTESTLLIGSGDFRNDPRVRVHRLEAESDPLLQLVQITDYPEKVDPLPLTKHSDPWIRAQAFQYVRDWNVLNNGVEDPSSLVRVVVADRVARLLDEQGSDVGCQIVHRFAQSPHAYERWKAAYGLSFCRDSEPVLVGLFQDVDIDVIRQAVLSMGEMSDALEYWNDLIALTHHSNSFVRRWTWKTIGRLPHAEVDTMLKQCIEKEASVLAKAECAKALQHKGFQIDTPRYVPPDLQGTNIDAQDVIQHPDPTHRKDAAKYLAIMNGGVEILEQLLQDNDGEVRKTAVESLGYAQSPLVWNGLNDEGPRCTGDRIGSHSNWEH